MDVAGEGVGWPPQSPDAREEPRARKKTWFALVLVLAEPVASLYQLLDLQFLCHKIRVDGVECESENAGGLFWALRWITLYGTQGSHGQDGILPRMEAQGFFDVAEALGFFRQTKTVVTPGQYVSLLFWLRRQCATRFLKKALLALQVRRRISGTPPLFLLLSFI